MKFSIWIEGRSQKDDMKMPKRKTSLELVQRAASKNIHGMQHGRAGSMDTDKKKGSRGKWNRKAIDDSARGE